MTAEPMPVPDPASARQLAADVLVVGGGTAGTMAALTAAERGASVLLLEKAHVRHSGALAMGMDGVNNAVIPGKATPEEYVADITRANDGVVNQRAVYQTASRGYDMVRRLEGYGVKFDKDSYGQYNVRKVHRSGSYVLPMPEGRDVKKVLYRVLRQRANRERIRIENRVMPVRVLTHDGRAVGAAGFHTRTGEFVTVRAGAVILATGACGRLGLPASGYLYGTYENPANAGDGHAMAYHAGAQLSGLECFQINPLIKDYNGPACAYVANPFGGYQVNSRGERFVDCDYWSGAMMAEVAREIESARGPIYLKLTHLAAEAIDELEGILHSTERPTRGTFHAGRGHDYRTHDVEMHISEIGLCGGHSASGVWVDEHGATTAPGLYAAGDLACVPHNYMLGAFVFGDLAGAHAAAFAADRADQADQGAGGESEEIRQQVLAAHELIYRPLRDPDGPPQPQVEYKLRRFVNDYLAPPKTGTKLAIAAETFARMSAEVAAMGARTPHELMRCVEVSFIRDCAELATLACLGRTESRWGLYHQRLDHPERVDADWLCHLNVRKGERGEPELLRRPVEPYLTPVPGFEPPAPGAVRRAVPLSLPTLAGLAAGRPRGESARADATSAASPRMLELVRLSDAQPTLAQLAPYLADDAPEVRRAAVTALTETTPAGFAGALGRALADSHPSVRSAAAASLRELVEVLPADPELRAALFDGTRSEDDAVRASALDVLRALRLGDRELFAAARTDRAVGVRLAAVAGLVALDEVEQVAAYAGDPSRAARIAAARGLGVIGKPGGVPALVTLAGDADPLVRAAALTAAAGVGCPPPLAGLALAALTDQAWQVRVGAATALAATGPELAADALVGAAADDHIDVRRAAIGALARWPDLPAVAAALRAAAQDVDADVRALARHALAEATT